MAFQFMPGATAIGLTYQDGIVLAAEKRITYGNFVVNKNTKKIFSITDQVASACAGMVADMQVLTRQVGALAKIRNKERDGYQFCSKINVSHYVRKTIFSFTHPGNCWRRT